MEDGVALLKHAAPVGSPEDSTTPWETAWTVRHNATSVSTPRKGLLRFSSSSNTLGQQTTLSDSSSSLALQRSPSNREEENASLVLGRKSHVEIDLLIQDTGRYYLAFDLGTETKKSALSNLTCCLPSAEDVAVHVELHSLDSSSEDTVRTFGAGFSISQTKRAIFTDKIVLYGDTILSGGFLLTPSAKQGQFRFDLTDSSRQYRLRAVMTTGRFNFSTKQVIVRLNRQRIPAVALASARSMNDLNAQIRRSHSRTFHSESKILSTIRHPLLQMEGMHKFFDYVTKNLVMGTFRVKRAGSETYHESKDLLKELSELQASTRGSDAAPRITAIPLRTLRRGFVENLSALKDFYTQAGLNTQEQAGEEDAEEEGGGEFNSKPIEPSSTRVKAPVCGRSVILRGVNLSGNTKMPMGMKTELPIDFAKLKDPEYCANEISYVGRPFPLEQADEHFSRLSRWGFNCLRFLVTWEALEHAGPGKIDEDYLTYLEEIIKKAGEYDLYVIIDPHQDVWSRFTGGSGAPAWTLEVCGIDVEKMIQTQSCFTHYESSQKNPAAFQKMSWPQNYQRFAVMHMFTLFFGGKQFAPDFYVDSEWTMGTNPEVPGSHPNAMNIQDYLQSKFLHCMREIAVRLAKYPHVLGFDMFNEPSAGFIGKHLDKHPETIIPNGKSFKPFEGMVVAAGIPCQVKVANGIGMLTSSELVNAERVSCWLEGRTDVWRAHGVWRKVQSRGTNKMDDDAQLLLPEYFMTRGDGSKWNFFRDFLRPFAETSLKMFMDVQSTYLLFLEGDAFGHKDFYWHSALSGNVVNATHWYDAMTLFMRRYNPSLTIDVKRTWPVIGRNNVRSMHMKDLREIIMLPKDVTNPQQDVAMPTLIGEFGCPFDINDSVGLRTGDFSSHVSAIASYYSMFDELQLNSTHWNYCAENSNTFGDHWNLENLSIFSTEQQTDKTDPDSGSRALEGFCRPWAPVCAGVRSLSKFDERSKTFLFRYLPSRANFESGDPLTCTIIYLPDCHFVSQRRGVRPTGLFVEVKNGMHVLVKLPGRHLLYVWANSMVIGSVIEPVEVVVKRSLV